MNYITLKRVWLPAIVFGLLVGLAGVTISKLVFSTSKANQHGYADVIAPVLPFTVSILTSHESPLAPSAISRDPLLSKFLQPAPEQSGLGSGIIISQDGLVVTNAHVVKAADNIVVISHRGVRAGVSNIWIDPETDVALLQTNLTVNADPPINVDQRQRIGDLVFTIGNPFGIGQSVSMGIISATGRQQPRLTTLTDFIQTDAAINPGNSGGALVNARGEVIGMNTAMFSANGSWQGIGFALPIGEVLKIAQELSKEGQVSRGYLGIDVQPSGSVSPTGAIGLEVVSVQLGSPAEMAGIKVGDRLLAINHIELHTRTEAVRLISSLIPEKKTSLTIQRGSEVVQLEVSLARR